jgi:hypothetical protein
MTQFKKFTVLALAGTMLASGLTVAAMADDRRDAMARASASVAQ